jgi:uncharacterized membrane protein
LNKENKPPEKQFDNDVITNAEPEAVKLGDGRSGPLSPELLELLRRSGINVSDPTAARVLIEASLMKFQGSLQFPPAEILKGWEDVCPGITQKLVEWSDRQVRHRHELEKQRADRSETRADRGQLIAAGIAILSLILATVLGLHDKTTASALMAILGIGGPAAAIALTSIRKPSSAP